ncbi:MAG: hypothetical protein AMXMBFR7_01390 [Planctomycetota bacterium]
MTPLTRGRLCIVGAAVCWSSAGALVKYANRSLDAWQIAGGRSFFAFLLLVILVKPWRRNDWWKPSPKLLLLSIAYPAMLIGYITALVHTTAANAIFLQDTAPVWVMLLSPFLLGERFRAGDLLLVALCAVGMLLFFNDQLTDGQAFGNMMALCSGLGFALVMIGLRWGRPKELDPNAPPPAGPRPPSDAELLIVYGNIFCVLGCLGFQGAWPPLEELPVPLATVVVLGVVQLGMGYYLMTHGIRQVSALEASLLALLEPILCPIWAFLTLNERPGPWAMVGSAVILLTVALQAFRGPGSEAK